MNIFKKRFQTFGGALLGSTLAFTVASGLLFVVPPVVFAQITIDNADQPTVTPGTIDGQGGTTELPGSTSGDWNWTNPTPTPAPTGTPDATDRYNGSYCPGTTITFDKLADIFRYFTCLLQRLFLPLCFVTAILVFVWGTVKFMMSSDSAEKEQGQQFMLWGVIGFAVMLSLWGLVNLIGVTFHTTNILPTIPATPPPSHK